MSTGLCFVNSARNCSVRRNILMDEYFVQNSDFSPKVTSRGLASKTVSTDFYSTQVDFSGVRLLCVPSCLLKLCAVLMLMLLDNMLYCCNVCQVVGC